ncbi:THO complex subunit 4A [Babesia sp. Xinjiang]|uniref:THO complex subunit 4A n=1 Tax=Babesia sp. Xinjiang TaxID=462227 RepID=UPI000A25211D|nr:THO complex subunit 4A [Babesia sp. Xinjiang]ORM41775.1 THO complex subunit 4A [Babesia sp. Xinjiang]
MHKARVIRKDKGTESSNRDRRRDYRSYKHRDDSPGTRRGHLQRYERPRYEARSRRYIVKVANLDYTVSGDKLKELFSEVGEIDMAWIDYDHTDRSKGTGGCIFKSVEDAKVAVSRYNGYDFDGRNIEVHGEYQERSYPPVRPPNRYRGDNYVKAPW